MCIRTTLACSVVVCVLISQALTVPVERKPVVNRLVQEKDNLVDELRLQSAFTEAPAELDRAITKSEEDKKMAGMSDLDEDDVYDLTVGDVIRDLLFTLREHPEIVKELIESERRKLMETMASGMTDLKTGQEFESGQVSSPRDMALPHDTVSAFELPPEQLTSIPKKVGHSGKSVTPIATGRVGGATDSKNDHSVETNDPDISLLHLLPKEGGQEDPMFDFERKQKSLSEHEIAGENGDVKTNDTFNLQTNEDPEQDGDNSAVSGANTEIKNIVSYKLPYINPLPFLPASFFSSKMNRQTDTTQPALHAKDTPSEIDQTHGKYSEQSIKPETADGTHAHTGRQERILNTSVKMGMDNLMSKNNQEATTEVSSAENSENKGASLNGLDDKAEMELLSLLQKMALSI